MSEIVHSLLSQQGAAPCMCSPFAELLKVAQGCGSRERLEAGLGHCGVARSRWQQHSLAALAPAEKGKIKGTRNCYFCAKRLYVNNYSFCICDIVSTAALTIHSCHLSQHSERASRCFVQGLRATTLNTGRIWKSFFKYSEVLSFCQFVCHKFMCSQHLRRRWKLNSATQFNTLCLKTMCLPKALSRRTCLLFFYFC